MERKDCYKSLLKGKRVLVVEDDVLIAYDLANLVEDSGGEVVGPAHTLADAKELVRQNHLDAALLDIDLNSIKVWPLATGLMEHQTPFAFVSAECGPGDLPEGLEASICISKPAMPDDILGALRSLLN